MKINKNIILTLTFFLIGCVTTNNYIYVSSETPMEGRNSNLKNEINIENETPIQTQLPVCRIDQYKSSKFPQVPINNKCGFDIIPTNKITAIPYDNISGYKNNDEVVEILLLHIKDVRLDYLKLKQKVDAHNANVLKCQLKNK